MITLFAIKFNATLFAMKNPELIIMTANSELVKERNKYAKAATIQENKLKFTNLIMSRNIFHAVNKGKFYIINEGGFQVLHYELYIYQYFIFFISIGFFLGIITKSGANWYLSGAIFLALIWVGTFISQKMFFSRILKKINGETSLD
jgi:hypothetical protein